MYRSMIDEIKDESMMLYHDQVVDQPNQVPARNVLVVTLVVLVDVAICEGDEKQTERISVEKIPRQC